MLTYPNIDPVALSLGPVQVHWYGLMYLFAFLAGWGLARWRASRPAWIAAGWNGQKVDDLLTWIMLGVVAGGRIGYVLFYDLPSYLAQPSEIFKIWNGGMSFHGGLLGVLLAGLWWSRREKKRFLDVVDFVAPLVPPGLFFGRLGNFINGELWGGVTDGPLGMVFPTGGPLPRHPSQLYEAGLEGLVMFVVMALAMTLLEYIVGVVSFKGFHLRLWDYSKQWGNIQGLICPKFSLAWALLGAAYYFLIHPRILHAIDWLSRNLAFSFVIGLFYGVFLIDVVYSTKLIHRIKKLADENEVIVKYENLKAHVRSVHDRSAQKASFFFPLRSERPLNEHLRELRETLEQRRRTGGKKHAG